MSDSRADPTPAPPVADPSSPYGGRFGRIDSLRRQAARGTTINSIYQIALAALGLLRGLGAAVFLTTSEYGTWGLLGLALWTVLGFKGLGVSQKYIQQSGGDQELAFRRAFTIELIFSAILLPAVVLVVCALAAITGHPEVIPAGLALALVVPGTALQFPVWTFYRRMDFGRQRLLQGIDPLVGTVVTITLAATGFGYWSLVIGAIVGAWAAAIGALHWRPYPLGLAYHRGTVRQYFSFSWPLVLGASASLATFYVIFLVGNEAIGLAGLGAFVLAGNLIRFTDKADAVITDTLYPALCAVQDRIPTLHEAFVKSNRLALMWAVPFGIGLALFSEDLVRYVLGREWASAIGLLQVIGVVTAVHHVGFNWHAFYRARAETLPIAIVTVASMLAVIGSVIPLMFAIGVAGIGWAFAAGEAVAFVLRSRYVMRLFSGFRPLRHLVRAMWPTTVAAGLVFAMRAAGGDGAGAGFALAELTVFLAVTIVATWAFERALLREALGYYRRKRAPNLSAGGASPAGG